MARHPIRTALLLVFFLVTIVSVWPGRHRPAHLDGGDPSLLTDRVWLEAMPASKAQSVHALLLLGDAPFGIFQRASAYRSTMEVFEHHREGAELRLQFPQSSERAAVSYRAAACSDHPPFDLCLQLSENPWGGPTRYFGFRDESAAGARIGALRHLLAHAAIDGL